MRKFLRSALDCGACCAGILVGTAATGSIWWGFVVGVAMVGYGLLCFIDGVTP